MLSKQKKESCSWFDAHYSDSVMLSLQIKKHIHSEQSPFQKIDVFDSIDFGRVLVLDNIINVAERDEFIYHEMLSHVPLFVHPNPENVLVVGGGDGGTIRESLKHSTVQKAYLVEIDSKVVEVSKKFFPKLSKGLNDQRVAVHYEDAAKFIQSGKNEFDVIMIDSTDPIGAGEKLFGQTFYRNCFDALKSDGIVTAQSESPFFDPDIVGALYKIAKNVFPIVRMYIAFMPSYVGGIWSFIYCSKKYYPVENLKVQRFNQTTFDTKYYNTEIHTASFCLPTFIKKQFDV